MMQVWQICDLAYTFQLRAVFWTSYSRPNDNEVTPEQKLKWIICLDLILFLTFSSHAILCMSSITGSMNPLCSSPQFLWPGSSIQTFSNIFINPLLPTFTCFTFPFTLAAIRIDFKILLLTCKILNNMAPSYLTELLQLYNPKKHFFFLLNQGVFLFLRYLTHLR